MRCKQPQGSVMRNTFPDLDSLLAYLYAPVLPYLRKIRVTRSGPREHNPRDILVPAGFEVELVASGFNAPVHCCFDGQGFCYVSEAGHKIDSKPRILKVDTRTGRFSTLLDLPEERWEKTGALTGSCWFNGALYFTNTEQPRSLSEICRPHTEVISAVFYLRMGSSIGDASRSRPANSGATVSVL